MDTNGRHRTHAPELGALLETPTTAGEDRQGAGDSGGGRGGVGAVPARRWGRMPLAAWESPAGRRVVGPEVVGDGARREAWARVVGEALRGGTRAEAAGRLGVSVRTVKRWATELRGRVVRAGDVVGADAGTGGRE